MRQQGILTKWNDDKGFGFINPEGGGAPAFVHISAFPKGRRRPVEKEPVSFVVVADGQKKLRAEQVEYQHNVPNKPQSKRGLGPAVWILVVFLAVLSGLALLGWMPFIVVGFYLLLSGVCFVLYALDKSAARRGTWRTAETTLHLLALIGGWPGALIAQRVLRHKTKKQPFQIIFWGSVIVNCAALIWLVSADGTAGLRSMLGFG